MTEQARDEPFRRPLMWLLVVATAVRVAYLAESLRLPFLRGPLGDSDVYLAQAERVVAGDFGHATLLALSPLYGYVLAALGREALLVVAVQLVLGVAVTGLIAVEVRRRFGARAGIAAGLLHLGYGFLLFLETKLLSDAIGLDLLVAGFVLYLRRGRAPALFSGLLFGLAVLARSSFVFSLPLLVLAALVPPRGESLRQAAQRAGAVAIGIALVVGANAGWTRMHAGVAVPIIYASSDVNVVARSSRTAWEGDLRAVALTDSPPGPWDRVHRVEAALAERAPDDLGGALGAVDLAGWFAQLPHRLFLTLSDHERTFQYGYYGERAETTTLELLPVTFPALFCLGLIGAAVLTRTEGARSLAPYLPLVLGAVAATTLAHPSSRYRLAMIVPLLWLGGLAVRWMWDARGTRLARGAAAVSLVVVTFGAMRGWTYELRHPEAWELTLAESYAQGWQITEAREHAERARALADDPDTVEPALRRLGL
ncbi:MAG: hypothetical protein AB8I08_25235 [Sandaracinaceae bacterium]